MDLSQEHKQAEHSNIFDMQVQVGESLAERRGSVPRFVGGMKEQLIRLVHCGLSHCARTNAARLSGTFGLLPANQALPSQRRRGGMIVGQERSFNSENGLSDQKRAEEGLQRMRITRKQPVNPPWLQRLAADLPFRFTHASWQDRLRTRGMGNRCDQNYWRRLVDRGVRFVIGGLWEISLRDCGD